MTDTKALSVVDGQASLAHVDSAPRLIAYIEDVKQAMLAVRTLHKEVLREGVDFGVIPGTGDKPCLLKPGAESLLMGFQLSVGEPTVEVIPIDAPVPGHREYRVKTPIIHRPTGMVIGYGLGSCSTMEKKYRYRRGERVCPKCGQPTIFKSKEPGGGFYCWAKKGGCGAKFGDNDKSITDQQVGQVENPDPADQYNTCLKMGKKRSLVDGTLTSCAASGTFTQDVEEGEERYVDPVRVEHVPPAPEPPAVQPAQAPAPAKAPEQPSTPPFAAKRVTLPVDTIFTARLSAGQFKEGKRPYYVWLCEDPDTGARDYVYCYHLNTPKEATGMEHPQNFTGLVQLQLKGVEKQITDPQSGEKMPRTLYNVENIAAMSSDQWGDLGPPIDADKPLGTG